MTPYEELKNILWTEKDWPLDCAPAPEASAVELAKSTPADVAEKLDDWLWNAADNSERPPDFPNDSAWKRQLTHQAFSIGKEFWEYGTALALGHFVEPPLDKIAEARSVSEWLRNQSLNRSRLGFPLFGNTPEGEAEYARRASKASDVPIEWAAAGKGLHWRLAVMEGMLPVTLDGFSAVYAAKNPSFDSIRNWDAQQWLDNLRAAHRQGRVRQKWMDDGSLNPEWTD